MNEIEEFKRLEQDLSEKAKRNNNIGLIFAVMMVFPILHYIGFIGFCFYALRWANAKKKACYYQGVIDGLRGLSKDDINFQASRMDD